MMILWIVLSLLVFLALSISYVFWRIAKQARHLDALQQAMATRKAREAIQSELNKARTVTPHSF